MRRCLGLLAVLCLAALPASAATVLRHLLWDANQRPLYQRCAQDFEAAHPDIRIRIQQQGWDDYWSTLSTGFIADTAPDVFTNHLAKYPELALNGVLLDLAPRIARDRVDTTVYEDGLLPLWQKDGRTYALPADWDTVALAVNLDMARRAGVGLEELHTLDWNPRDGGSFGRLLARLTRDEAGRDATQPGFDAQRVAVRGLATLGAGGMMGQTEWSHFAVSAGWRFQARPWDPELRYDDPLLAGTLDWLASLPRRGWMASPQQAGKLGADAMFLSGRAAVTPAGAWMAGHFARQARFPLAWVPLPVGPSGQRATMRNGLAHSVWSGTRHPEEAWQWLRHLGSPACQSLVAQAGTVYPAVKGLASVALDAQARQGIDARAFLSAAQGLTYPPPIAPHGAELTDLMGAAIESVLSGRRPAAQALAEVAPRVRAIARRP